MGQYIKSNFIASLIVLGAAVLAGWGLVHSGLPPTHDGEYHVVRFYEFDKILRQGSFYPRWAPDLNYGYGVPLFTYVYPFPNYIASISHLLGSSFIDSFKINMFLALLVGAIFFYLWAKEFWGTLGGIVSSIFYTFSPYHFVDIYIRGSVGEVWALAWYPACLWAITKVVKEQKMVYAVVGSITFACIIFSHNILALAFFPFGLAYSSILLVCAQKKGRSFVLLLVVFLLGLGLSLIFWLPALVEAKYTVGLQVFGIDQNFPDLYQLLIPSWGSEFFGTGSGTEMSVQIGLANLLVIFLSFIVLIFLIRKHIHMVVPQLFFLLSFVGIFVLMLKVSLPVWIHVPLMHYFQFSWRLLSLEILICSFLAGSIIYVFRSIILVLVLISITILFSLNYDKPSHYLYRSDEYYITRSNFIDGTNSPGNAFGTVWMHNISQRASNKITIPSGMGKFSVKKQSLISYIIDVDVPVETKIQANIAYFPGWTVKIDKKKNTIFIPDRGNMTFTVPRGKHRILLYLDQTTLEKIASLGTLLASILVLTLLYKSWYMYNRKNEYCS